MKSGFLLLCLTFPACCLADLQSPRAKSIDELIRDSSGEKSQGEWSDIRSYESWKVKRFLKMTRFFHNAVHYDFLTTSDEEFSIVVESDGRWPEANPVHAKNRFYVEFEDKRYPILLGSVVAENTRKVLSTAPQIPRLKKSRRRSHVQDLLDIFENEVIEVKKNPRESGEN